MKRLQNRLALALAVIHLGLVSLVGVSVLGGEDPVAWLVFLPLDFPVSLAWAALNSLATTFPGRAGGSIVGDMWNFLFPLGFLAVVGTAWWYFVGLKIQRWRLRKPPGTSWWSHNVY